MDVLRSAVALADELGSPLLRWQARAALALAERGLKRTAREGAAATPDRDAAEAAEIIESVAAALSPERAATYLAATPVVEALALAR